MNSNRKCCLEKKQLEESIQIANSWKKFSFELSYLETVRDLNYIYRIILQQWRDRNISDMINCSNCSPFINEFPFSLVVRGKIVFDNHDKQ